MAKYDDGGPAFPGTAIANPGEWAIAPVGMSLLDYFAGQALVGLINGRQDPTHVFAKEAYMVAESMLAERKRRMGEKC